MHYKLFCPGATKANDDMLREHGLEDLCRGGGAEWERVPAGPADGPGTVGTWTVGNPQLDAPQGMPAEFEWTQIPKTPLWVGINPALPPGPMELQHKAQLPSLPLVLADGRTWRIPIARGVPFTIGADGDGEPMPIVEKRYEEYNQRTFRHATLLAEREEQIGQLEKVFFGVKLTDEEMREVYLNNVAGFAGMETLDEMDQSLAVTILFDEAIEHACDALSINYRLNRFLVCHFQLLKITPTQNHLRDVCLCAMEASEIMESLKKNDMERRISLLAESDMPLGDKV